MAARLNHALDSRTFLRGSYRYYNDTWGIRSHTAQVGLGRYFFRRDLLVDVGYRRYSQGAADFYADAYSTPQALVTGDYRLSKFDAGSGQVKLVYAPNIDTPRAFLSDLRIDLAFEHYGADNGFHSNLWQLGASGGF